MPIFHLLPYTFPVLYNTYHNVKHFSCYVMITSRYECRVPSVRMTFIQLFCGRVQIVQDVASSLCHTKAHSETFWKRFFKRYKSRIL